MQYATKSNHQEMGKMLINTGANVDAQNHWGKTALYYATESNHQEMAQILINAGATKYVRKQKQTQTYLYSKTFLLLQKLYLLLFFPQAQNRKITFFQKSASLFCDFKELLYKVSMKV